MEREPNFCKAAKFALDVELLADAKKLGDVLAQPKPQP